MRDDADGTFHTGAWCCWLAAALAPPLLTRNPLYLAAALAATGAVYLALGRGAGAAAAGWGAVLRLGLIVVALSTLVQPLLVHQGATVLFTLPSRSWTAEALGRTLGTVEIGGRVTLESVVYGGGRGLALLAVLLAFAAFNARVDPYQLLRRVPRFLYRSGIVLSIALAFVPQMLAAQREIREAQALRGHRFRGVRDLVPLLVALLAEGLERSIDLAESMEARGFGAAAGTGAGGRPPLSINALHAALAAALALLLAGAGVRAFYPEAAAGWAALAAGALLLVATLAAVGRRVRRSRFRREPWRRRDTALAVCSAAAFAAFAAASLTGRPTLLFYPYPQLPAPPFHPALATALALLAAPALAARSGRPEAPAPP